MISIPASAQVFPHSDLPLCVSDKYIDKIPASHSHITCCCPSMFEVCVIAITKMVSCIEDVDVEEVCCNGARVSEIRRVGDRFTGYS